MARIIISEFISDAGLDVLRGHDVVYDESLADDPDRLRVLAAGAEGLIVRNRTRVSADLIEGSPPLKVVGRLGVGLDNIDVEACRRRDVEVCAAFGANAESVAEYVITAVLLLIRGVFMVTDDVIAGQWPRTSLRGLEVRGRTLGLVGLGDIGRRIALGARSLGLEVIAHDPYLSDDDEAWQLTQQVSLRDLFMQADAVSVNVPLTDETVGLVGPEVLALMKPDAVLVNTARGGVVDEDALIAALRDERIRGAALDVMTHEPLGAVEGEKFRDVPNLVLTPHVAGITEESNDRVSVMVAEAVDRVVEGIPR